MLEDACLCGSGRFTSQRRGRERSRRISWWSVFLVDSFLVIGVDDDRWSLPLPQRVTSL